MSSRNAWLNGVERASFSGARPLEVWSVRVVKSVLALPVLSGVAEHGLAAKNVVCSVAQRVERALRKNACPPFPLNRVEPGIAPRREPLDAPRFRPSRRAERRTVPSKFRGIDRAKLGKSFVTPKAGPARVCRVTIKTQAR